MKHLAFAVALLAIPSVAHAQPPSWFGNTIAWDKNLNGYVYDAGADTNEVNGNVATSGWVKIYKQGPGDTWSLDTRLNLTNEGGGLWQVDSGVLAPANYYAVITFWYEMTGPPPEDLQWSTSRDYFTVPVGPPPL